MFSLKEKIFDLFGVEARRNDSYKDENGKGLWQRYNEALAEDFDEQLYSYIDKLLDYTLIPETVRPNMLAYLEDMFGEPVVIDDTIESRQRLLRFVVRLYQLKGTARSYEILVKLMGLDSVTITEIEGGGGFDSAVNFDDPERRFDSEAFSTGKYSLHITGTLELDQELKDKIKSVVRFCEPINASLAEIFYNAVAIRLEAIRLYLDNEGYMWYDNTNNPDLEARLVEGKLILDGPDAEKYRIDENGNLIYTE